MCLFFYGLGFGKFGMFLEVYMLKVFFRFFVFFCFWFGEMDGSELGMICDIVMFIFWFVGLMVIIEKICNFLVCW